MFGPSLFRIIFFGSVSSLYMLVQFVFQSFFYFFVVVMIVECCCLFGLNNVAVSQQQTQLVATMDPAVGRPVFNDQHQLAC